jgi:hypothetical protein
VSEAAPELGGLRAPGVPPVTAPAVRELFVRHARKEGRSVAILRAVDYGDSCVVEAEVFPVGPLGGSALRPGPYTFGTPREATAFVTEAVEALMVLGCDVYAQ